MNESQASELVPGSRVRYREADGQFELELPVQPRRMIWSFGNACVVVVALLLVVILFSDGWLPAFAGFGLLACVLLSIAFASLADWNLTTTYVLINRNRVVVKTGLYGKEQLREFALDPRSRARQWCLRQQPGRYGAKPRGIEIGPEPYDREAGSPLRDESKPRFGNGLSRGEMDWIAWRINQFLDKNSPEHTSVEQVLDSPAPRPKDIKTRIETSESGSRVIFPNTIETRTFAGVFNVLWLGLAMPSVALPFIIPWCKQIQTPGKFASAVLVVALISLLAITAVFNGLTQLFGRRELQITTESITYRAALLGIGLRLTLRMAHVISMGVARGQRHSLRLAAIAPTEGCVIRTAERELRYSAAVPKGEGPWVIDEVARRVAAVRTATDV
jgi:uncharacterized membrane protein